jgi:lysophospholipase L1-like esterase
MRFNSLVHRCIFGLAAMSLAASVASLGCAAAATHQSKKPNQHGREGSIHFVGRVERLPEGKARHAWSGTGFVARFRGTGVAVRWKDDKNEHQVVLDGKLLPKVVTRAGVEQYPLAEGLALGDHRLEVYRRTEALFGPTTFLGLDVIGGEILADVTEVRRRIEIVGDSISCGYGIEGTSTSCHFSASTENHYLSYGAVLARQLDAEVSTIAWSGRGVVKNYNGELGDKMGLLYQRVLPESTSSQWSRTPANDVVIVNLGTNDYSTDPDPEANAFIDAYVSLLEEVRRNNPHALILCTIGPMLAGRDLELAESSIGTAVERRNAVGDKRAEAYRLQTRNENPGCDWHPGIATHQRVALELAGRIKSELGW